MRLLPRGIFLLAVASFLSSSLCTDEEFSDENNVASDDELGSARKSAHVCSYPECSCTGHLFVTVNCKCQAKQLDFSVLNFPSNSTLRVYDCQKLHINLKRKPKIFFETLEINHIASLTINKRALEDVNYLIFRNVDSLLSEDGAFESLVARNVHFESVAFPKGFVFKPRYLLQGLTIANSTFDSVGIHLDVLHGTNRTIVISDNKLQNSVLSLYSHFVTLKNNTFDTGIENVTIRHEMGLVSSGNNYQEKTYLPDVYGDGQRLEIVFENSTGNLTNTEKNWLKSFTFPAAIKKSIQPRTLEKVPSNDSTCIQQQLIDDIRHHNLVIVCPDLQNYIDFIDAGEKQMSPAMSRNKRQRKEEKPTILTQQGSSGASSKIANLIIVCPFFYLSLSIT